MQLSLSEWTRAASASVTAVVLLLRQLTMGYVMNEQVIEDVAPVEEEAERGRIIAVINGKGGAGKTTMVANLGALYALAGYRVLCVDLDPQGNLGADLGYNAAQNSDLGRSMGMALSYNAELNVLRDVRPNLDVVCGGSELEIAVQSLQVLEAKDPHVAHRLHQAIDPLLHGYDIILLDTPPNITSLQKQALTAADYALVTSRTDSASLDEGVANIARVFGDVRTSSNPDVTLIGGLLFATSYQGDRETRAATGRHVTAREKLKRLCGGTEGIVFSSWIRYAEAAADDARDGGQAVHELEQTVAQGPSWHEALKMGQARLASSAGNLAGDHQRVAQELVYRIEVFEETGDINEACRVPRVRMQGGAAEYHEEMVG